MSRTEIHRGRIVPFKREEQESDENYLRRFISKIGETFQEDVWEEGIQDYIYSDGDLFEKVFYVNGKLYENAEHQEYEDLDADEFSGNEVDGYAYFTSFYNGGTCLSEIIEEHLEKLDK